MLTTILNKKFNPPAQTPVFSRSAAPLGTPGLSARAAEPSCPGGQGASPEHLSFVRDFGFKCLPWEDLGAEGWTGGIVGLVSPSNQKSSVGRQQLSASLAKSQRKQIFVLILTLLTPSPGWSCWWSLSRSPARRTLKTMPQKCPRFVPPENMEHHNFVSFVHRDCCVCQKKGLGGSIRHISKHRHRRNVMSYCFKSLFKLFSLSFYCFHLSDCFKFFDYFHFCDYYNFFDYSCYARIDGWETSTQLWHYWKTSNFCPSLYRPRVPLFSYMIWISPNFWIQTNLSLSIPPTSKYPHCTLLLLVRYVENYGVF